jgi:dCMP deaminase
MSETDWFARYIALAEHVAQWSKDPSTKVGAVVVGIHRRNIAMGYNGFPPRVADTEDRLNDREVKYRFMQHAERNALDNAEFNLDGGTLAVTLHPCVECAKSIVSRGIHVVVCPGMPFDERWVQQSRWAADIMREAGVTLVYTRDGHRILRR